MGRRLRRAAQEALDVDLGAVKSAVDTYQAVFVALAKGDATLITKTELLVRVAALGNGTKQSAWSDPILATAHGWIEQGSTPGRAMGRGAPRSLLAGARGGLAEARRAVALPAVVVL